MSVLATTQRGSFADIRVGARGFALALLAYAVALPLLLLVPPFITAETGYVPGFTWQEAIDLFTPVVILPLFALALVLAGGLDRRGVLLFTVIAAVWVSGQGIHLAANGIRDAVLPSAEAAFLATPAGQVAHWLDEVLSHWLWHAAWVALVVQLVLTTWGSRGDADGTRSGAIPYAAGAIQGFTWFVVTVEGLTAALGIPAALGFIALGVLGRRDASSAGMTRSFVLATGLMALLGYAVWAAINGGTLPEFTKWTWPF